MSSSDSFTFVSPVGDPRYRGEDGNIEPSLIATPVDHQTLRGLGNWQSDSAYDLGIPCGTPVRAPLSGKIVRSGPQAAGVKYAGDLRLAIDDGHGHAAFLGHLESIDASAALGMKVVAGQLIGKSGRWGQICHLHFSMGHDYINHAVANGIDSRPFLEDRLGAFPTTPTPPSGKKPKSSMPARVVRSLALTASAGILGFYVVPQIIESHNGVSIPALTGNTPAILSSTPYDLHWDCGGQSQCAAVMGGDSGIRAGLGTIDYNQCTADLQYWASHNIMQTRVSGSGPGAWCSPA
jgi:hypothetical protein